MPRGDARRVTRREILSGLGAAAIGTTVGAAAHGFMYERHRIEVKEESLAIAGWPEALAGLRIGLVTDLHRSATVSHELIAGAVRDVMARAPDLIVLGGDYVTHHDTRYAGAAADALRGLAAPHGVFAVLGNHDDDHAVPAALRGAGFEVLRDARTTLRIRGETVDIAGLRYWNRKKATVASVLKGRSQACILAAHDPRRLVEAAALSVPLLLSGHTHGGQIVLPWLGAVAARRFPVLAGSARRGTTTIYVSRGVGTVYVPVRLNCPPEVAILNAQPLHAHRSKRSGSE
jgi:predicted MPP superfamily phosphohydrolase